VTAGPTPGKAGDRVRTIFFGSGSFAVPILVALTGEQRLDLVGVVTAPDRPAGRDRAMTRTPVAQRARELGLPLLQPARVRAPEAIAELAALAPALGVLADYGQIAPRAVLDLPAMGILNVHPSLLPRHRGAAPIQATIASGDELAGVSIFRMDEGVDTGPILAAASWSLDGTERAPTLEADAARRAADLLVRSLDAYLDGTATLVAQDEGSATVTRPFRREDARVDPARPAVELERRIRANEPWPGTFIETAAGRVLIHAASVAPSMPGERPGMLIEHDGRIALTTRRGRLVLERAQLAGRRTMPGDELLRGQRRLIGTSVAVEASGGAGERVR
jgi:methionyl-tRNA formyltransferase